VGTAFRLFDPDVNEFQVTEAKSQAVYRFFVSAGEISRRAPHFPQNRDGLVAGVPQDEQRIASALCTGAGGAAA